MIGGAIALFLGTIVVPIVFSILFIALIIKIICRIKKGETLFGTNPTSKSSSKDIPKARLQDTNVMKQQQNPLTSQEALASNKILQINPPEEEHH